jgi:F-type H+-transporting ATPase subunit b
LFVAQVINFLILAVLIKLFLYKPIKGVLEERRQKISQGLNDAEQSRVLLSDTQKEKDGVLKATRLEAQSIIEGARTVAEEVKQKVLEESKAESERIIAQAKAQAALELEKMQKQVKVMSVDLSQKILVNMIGNLFSEAEKGQVLKKAMEKLETADYGQGKS